MGGAIRPGPTRRPTGFRAVRAVFVALAVMVLLVAALLSGAEMGAPRVGLSHSQARAAAREAIQADPVK
jgi:hypothetical protein